jgi:hypothetical protein
LYGRPGLTVYGSLVGAAMAISHVSKAPRHILALNAGSIKILDIEKGIAAYLGTYKTINKADMLKVKISGLLDKTLYIKTSENELLFMLFRREYGFTQRKEYRAFISNFKKYYK